MADPKPHTKAALSQKQQSFVAEYLVDGNATRAAQAAGYSERTADSQGSRLLKNVKVAAAIQREQNAKRDRARVTMDMVIEGLWREANAGDMGEPNAARIRAYELVGKHLGGFVDRKHITIKPIDEMTEAELAALVGEESESAEAVH